MLLLATDRMEPNIRSLLSPKNVCIGVFEQDLQFFNRGPRDEAVEFLDPGVVLIPRTQLPELLGNGCDKGTGVVSPRLVLPFAFRDQGLGQLISVVVLLDLGKQVPAPGVLVERAQNHIPGLGVVKPIEVPRVGVGDDGAIAASERGAQEFADGRALAGSGGADQLEVLGFIQRVELNAGKRQGSPAYSPESARAGRRRRSWCRPESRCLV